MTSNPTKTQMVRSYLSRNYGKANKRLVNRTKFVDWAATEGIASTTALNLLYTSGYHLVIPTAQFVERIDVGFTSTQFKALGAMSLRTGYSPTQIIRDAVSSTLGI